MPEPAVGIVAASLTGGGAERQAALWATALHDSGRVVRVLALLRHGEHYDVPPGVVVETVGKTAPHDVMPTLAAIRRLARCVDVIVAFQPYAGALCASVRLGVPWMIVTGDDPRHWRDTSRVPACVYRTAFRRAAAASAPSAGLVALHERLGLRPRGPFQTIPNAVPDAAYVEPGTDRVGVLFVGRLVPEKRPSLALEATRRARLPITIVGEGPLRAQLAGARLTGFTPSPWELYRRHRVLVSTSRYETFANVIAEGLAAGTPAVAVDCDFGPREILEGARFSRLVAADPDAIAAALTAVVASPPGAAERAECARIAARYRLAALTPRIVAAVDGVVAEPAHA